MRCPLPFLFVASLVAAGCAPKEEAALPLPRDAVATPNSAAILAPYTGDTPRPQPAPGVVRPAGVSEYPHAKLPGEPERPWLEAPRTLPYPDKPAPAPEVGTVKTVRSPAGKGALRPGDRIEVAVAGHPEFSGDWSVRADGKLDIPDGGAFGVKGFAGRDFAARVGSVRGFTARQVARIIRGRLRRYTRRSPRVEVKILRRREG